MHPHPCTPEKKASDAHQLKMSPQQRRKSWARRMDTLSEASDLAVMVQLSATLNKKQNTAFLLCLLEWFFFTAQK